MSKKLIYFLCTGNSCRSQMAEGFAKKYLPNNEFDIYSAGIEAHGINPTAIKVMDEKGIDISDQTSDKINLEILANANYIITLCGDANDTCPTTPPQIYREHWLLNDPAKIKGAESQILNEFRCVRDKIERNVKRLVIKVNYVQGDATSEQIS